VPSIVGWVNDLFGGLMQPRPGTRFQPGYESIEAYRDEPRPDASRVLLLIPADPVQLEEARAEEVRLAEARHVVALLRKAVEEAWPTLDRETKELRPIRFGDVALLFRTSTALEVYEEVLRQSAVPYRIAGGRRYYLRAEMRALLAALSAIESPHDALAVVSALRCPFFGCSDEDLLARKAAGGDWIYTKEGAGRGTPFERVFDLLARLHAKRHTRPVAATLEELFDLTGALSLFYMKPDGDQRAANLLKAIDLARAHEAAGGATFGSFVRWLSGMSSSERDEGEAPLSEEVEGDNAEPGGDAVRIFTVHKAKGLEFPMAILCDSAGKTANTAPTCVIERGLDPAASPSVNASSHMEFCAGAGPRRLESSGYAQAAEREKERLEAERLRLFYVAATRARDYLVIPSFGGKSAGGLHAALREAGFLAKDAGAGTHRGAALLDGATLDTAPRTVEPFRIAASEATPSDASLIAEKAGWRKALELTLRAPSMGREFRVPSEMETTPEIGHAGGAGSPAAKRRALALGSAVHAVLERIDLGTGRRADMLSEEASDRAGYPDLAREVESLVLKAIQSRIIKEAIAAPRCFREMPFAAAGDGYLTEGRIDLVFESGGTLTVVDFKTDDVATEPEIASRVAAYEAQALIYARAMTQVTGLPVDRVVFLFIRPGVEKTVKVDDPFLQRARRLLETGTLAARPMPLPGQSSEA
jgi:ATP-dependent exoDNAse (exonuclease V) beta subunit